jgi:hypothetical protein
MYHPRKLKGRHFKMNSVECEEICVSPGTTSHVFAVTLIEWQIAKYTLRTGGFNMIW